MSGWICASMLAFQLNYISVSANITYETVGVIPGNVGTLTLADLDGDTANDLLIRTGNEDIVYVAKNLNDGQGSLGDVYPLFGENKDWISNSNKLLVSDFNLDGWMDVVVCISGTTEFDIQTGDGTVLVGLNDGNGSFRQLDPALLNEPIEGPVDTITTPRCRDMVVADMNNDGYDDILVVVVDWSKSMLLYIENDGSGKFLQPTILTDSKLGGSAIIAVSDIDQDGRLDTLVAAQDTKTFFIYYQESLGNYVHDMIDIDADEIVGSIEAITVENLSGDNDGQEDIVIYGNDGVNVYWNDGNGVLTKFVVDDNIGPDVASTAHNIIIFDVDGDGKNDIVTTIEPRLGLNVYRQTGYRTFASAEVLVDGYKESMAFGDIDGDGIADLVVSEILDDRLEFFWLLKKS